MTEEETKNKIEQLRSIERDFEKIELQLKTPNIFRILNISKAEIRHSNFLAWLLNPTESHNLRGMFLKHFLLDNSIDFDVVDFQNVEIRREWKNIDLLLIVGKKVVCIENKVDSQEHSNQLKRYNEIVDKNFDDYKRYFIYLTPNADLPSDDMYEKYSYRQISESLEKIIELHDRTLTSEVKQYISDYVDILKIEIMKEHDMNNLAMKIYNNHKDAFDFIFDNKPDLASDFRKYFERKVIEKDWILGSPNKGYVRFLTKPLKEIIPKLQGWKEKEAFTFEIDYFWDNQKRINFVTIIAPGTGSELDNGIIKILNDCLTPIQGQKPQGKKWLVHFREKWKFDLQIMTEKSDEEINQAIEKFWAEITVMVNKVEAEILKQKDTLLNLKNKQLEE